VFLQSPSLEKLHSSRLFPGDHNISVLREDLVHPVMGGNKWRKLKYNLEDFKNSGKKVIVTFGGAYSNHLCAVAVAGKQFGFNTVGVIRGENISNERIALMKTNGMKLHFIDRSSYRLKEDVSFLEKLAGMLKEKGLVDHPQHIFYLPEGGNNLSAVKGAAEIMNDIPTTTNYICCAMGTGATLAGISSGLKVHQRALGIAVLKGENFLEKTIKGYGVKMIQTEINHDFHFGGYAKTDQRLLNFCDEFNSIYNFKIEPVYTGKLFFGISDLISEKYLSGKNIVVVHTGGVF
jgi:1-aminocyclopropane-1-carboxylate deaminase